MANRKIRVGIFRPPTKWFNENLFLSYLIKSLWSVSLNASYADRYHLRTHPEDYDVIIQTLSGSGSMATEIPETAKDVILLKAIHGVPANFVLFRSENNFETFPYPMNCSLWSRDKKRWLTSCARINKRKNINYLLDMAKHLKTIKTVVYGEKKGQYYDEALKNHVSLGRVNWINTSDSKDYDRLAKSEFGIDLSFMESEMMGVWYSAATMIICQTVPVLFDKWNNYFSFDFLGIPSPKFSFGKYTWNAEDAAKVIENAKYEKGMVSKNVALLRKHSYASVGRMVKNFLTKVLEE